MVAARVRSGGLQGLDLSQPAAASVDAGGAVVRQAGWAELDLAVVFREHPQPLFLDFEHECAHDSLFIDEFNDLTDFHDGGW